MALHNNPRLLSLSCSLLFSFHLALSELSPAASPSQLPESSPGSVPIPSPSPGPASVPTPSPGPASVPLPSPAAYTLLNHVSFPPSISEPPSRSISPNADAPAESDGPFQFDFSTILAPSVDVNPKLKEICDSTDYPSLCLATVVPFLNGKTDVPSVLEVIIRAGAKLAKYGLSLAKNFAEKTGAPPELLSILEDCKDSYDSAVYNFQNTINAFLEHDIGTMNSMLSAVITDVGDCEDAFSGLGEQSPLSSVADRLTNMTSNCLAIVSLLD
ncbi:hypothetical protein Pfo_025954 [Paulownia fortunei]|nr:hypothetical protein Pfo_025954 [Paulownia fortunei]